MKKISHIIIFILKALGTLLAVMLMMGFGVYGIMGITSSLTMETTIEGRLTYIFLGFMSLTICMALGFKIENLWKMSFGKTSTQTPTKS